jgi:TPR repeat protein
VQIRDADFLASCEFETVDSVELEFQPHFSAAASAAATGAGSTSAASKGEVLSVLGAYFASGAFVGAKNREKAFHCYKVAAEECAYAPAMLSVGIAYEFGRGVKSNERTAFEWYLKAASGGFAPAQFQVAEAYASGMGVEEDATAAIEWYLKAAKSGHAIGKNKQLQMDRAYHSSPSCVCWQLKITSVLRSLLLHFFERTAAVAAKRVDDLVCSVGVGWGCAAVRYETGRGVERDMSRAFYWYMEAAKNGSACAAHNVYLCYTDGLGVKADAEAAHGWLVRSAKGGYLSAKRKMGDRAKSSATARYHLNDSFRFMGGGKAGVIDAEHKDGERARFGSVDCIAVHAASGDVFVADHTSRVIWKLSPPVRSEQAVQALQDWFPAAVAALIVSYFRLDRRSSSLVSERCVIVCLLSVCADVVSELCKLPAKCTVSGSGSLACDPSSGVLYLADCESHCIRRIERDGMYGRL